MSDNPRRDVRPLGVGPIQPVSMRDTAGVVADVLLPLVAEGLIMRRPRIVGVLDRLDDRRRAVRRLQLLRDRYGDGPAVVQLPGRRLAFVLSGSDARRVLEQTPEPFTPASREKRAALTRFEPHGVLVSSGPARERRRHYNEEILETSRPVHHMGHRFAEVIDVEVDGMLDQAGAAGTLDWDLFARAWWRVVRRIVLGDGARDDERVTDDLARLRADANWGPLARRRRRRRAAFLDRLRHYVAQAEAGSLAAHVAAAGADGAVDPVQQIPQWLFAFDAAGMASFRALALLDAHPGVAGRVREEIASPGAGGDAGGERWPLLRACVLESLRLWPTTPAILRDATADTAWRDGTLSAGTGLVIFVPFFHRDARTLAQADAFSPDLWLGGHDVEAAPMPFSLGPAECPGRNLVLLTTTTLAARLLATREATQQQPRPLRAGVPLPGTLSPFRLCFAARRPRTPGARQTIAYAPAGRVKTHGTQTHEGVIMAKKARDVMSGGAECIGERDTVADAARRLADLDVGAMPICGEDDRLKGMLTDRDIVVKVIAAGKDPASTTAGEIADQPEVVTIGADDSVDEALRTMADHKVRRLPVIDGHRLIGVVSQADLAKEIDSEKVGELVEAISAAP